MSSTRPAEGNATAASGSTRIAAIDIGSNSVRQIVADVSDDGAIRVVDEMKEAPRLGIGLDADGALREDAIQRVTACLARMATLARQLGAARIEAVATSAVRDARNRDDLVAHVRRETGLSVRVLTGEEEARLCFRSAVAHFDVGNGRAAVLDIGGGSLELALSVDGVLDALLSWPLGALRLTERFLHDGSSPGEVQALRRNVRERLREQVSVREWRGARLIGSGGTLTNLAAMHLAQHSVSGGRSVHATPLSRRHVERMLEALAVMTPGERRAVPGLSAERADIIVAGIAATAEVMALLDAPELLVSRYGIREGILLEAAQVRPAPGDGAELRQRSVRELARRCHYDEAHAQHVRHLALLLLEALAPDLGCDVDDEALLGDAALLHDIGHHISYERHHKHSHHLIVHAELLGISPSELAVLANVARYHRGTPPRKKHRDFRALDKAQRARVRRLAAVLRIADGLDRGHQQAVARVDIANEGGVCTITLEPRHDGQPLRLEAWGAQQKSDLLQSLLGRPVEIVAGGEVAMAGAVAGEALPDVAAG